MKNYIIHTKDKVIKIAAQGMMPDDKQATIRFYVGNEIVACVSIQNVIMVVEEDHLYKK
jgi:hypothetical protein